MLGSGSAGMIGQNAHTVAHAKLRYFDIASGPGGDDAMLLIGAQDDDAVIGPAVWIADQAVILIHGLARLDAGRPLAHDPVDLSMLVVDAAKSPEVTQALEAQGVEPASNSPEIFAKFIVDTLERYRKVAKEENLKFE